MRLEVGMYVRTNKGRIGKVITDEYEYKDSYNQQIEFKDDVENTWDMDFEDVVDSSFNKLRLVRVDDFVNGYRVLEVLDYPNNTKAILIDDEAKSIIWEESASYIKSLTTKEQFEEVTYDFN